MGAVFGGPTTTRVPAPNPLFPGMQNSYISQLQSSGVTGSAFNTLNSMAQTGNPTDIGPAFQALKASMAQQQGEGAANLKEQFGSLGLGSGNNLAQAASDYEANSTAQLNNTLAQYQLQASESAANRQLAASTTGAQLASEPALAFTPSAVVSQQPGILGGLMSLFSALFPGGAGQSGAAGTGLATVLEGI